MLWYTAAAALIIMVVSWIFVWRMVRIPLQRLQSATQKLMAGELGYQTDVATNDEAGNLRFPSTR